MSAETSTPQKRVLKPIIISSDKKMLLKSPNLLTNFKLTIKPYKEDVIYSAKNCDFLKGDSQDVLIVNRVELATKSCRTVAKCTSKGVTVETTSDAVSNVIGQKNFETVLSALSSVFNEETKIRGILALLTSVKKKNTATQTHGKTVESYSQTVDTRVNLIMKERQKKRIRRQPLQPYVVTENEEVKIKRLVIDVDSLSKSKTLRRESSEDEEDEPNFPNLHIDDDNMSTVSNVSLSSIPSVPGILDNPEVFFSAIDKVTDNTLNPYTITLKDGSKIMVPIKPEDEFHIATPDILKNVTHEERLKLIWHQAFVDFTLCLQQDEEGYYPLHIAVLHNDADLVKRLCAAVRARRETVDVPGGPDKLTALHTAIRQNCAREITRTLLQNGADPLVCDQERRSSFHLAADENSDQLEIIVQYCDKNAKDILRNHPKLWRPEFENEYDYRKLAKRLFEHVSEMFDDQGYTPLMLSAEAGLPQHTFLLASRAGALVDAVSPTSGATALYRVVADTCHQLKDCLTAQPSHNYLKTIEILVEHGADPSVENHAGSSVNTLLTEFNISTLSMTIANKMTAMKHGRHTGNLNMILYKQNDGTIDYKDINSVCVRQNSRKRSNKCNSDVNKDDGNDETNFTTDTDANTDFNDVQHVKLGTARQIKISNVVTLKNNINISLKTADNDNNGKVSIKTVNKDDNETPDSVKDKRLVKRYTVVTDQQESNARFTPKVVKVIDVKREKPSYTPKIQLNKLIMKDTDNETEVSKDILPAANLKRIANDLEKSVLAADIKDDTRPAKERKTDNVVIVENISLKKGNIPKILRAATSQNVKSANIVITRKTGEKIVLTKKDEMKLRKLNIKSE